MLHKAKTAGAQPAVSARKRKTHRQLSIDYTPPAAKLSSTRALGDLLDQALVQYEHHNSLARFHAGQAAKHRAILTSLQKLIPRRKFEGGQL